MSSVQLQHKDHNTTRSLLPLSILAHDIAVPMNVGSIFRIADALGVERIYLTGKTIRPPNRKIRKTSRSTENTVVYEEADDPIAVLVRLKNSGYKIICLEITNDSVDIRDAVFSSNDRICLVLGSENEGIPTELLAASDFAVHIPMFGVNSSMNVASACSIASFEITKGLMHG